MLWPEYLTDRFNAHGESLVVDLWENCKDYSPGNFNNYFEASRSWPACTRARPGPSSTCWPISPPGARCAATTTTGLLPARRRVRRRRAPRRAPAHLFPAFSPPPDDLPAPPYFFGSNFARFDQGITGPDLTVYFQGQPWNYNQATDTAEALRWKVGLVRIHERGVSSSYQIFDVPLGSTLVQATGSTRTSTSSSSPSTWDRTTEPYPTQPLNEYSYVASTRRRPLRASST